MLTWTAHDDIAGAITSVGVRGVYTIQKMGPAWHLSGVGHDGLWMPGLPPGGQILGSLELAQTYAQRVDARPAPAEVSGG